MLYFSWRNTGVKSYLVCYYWIAYTLSWSHSIQCVFQWDKLKISFKYLMYVKYSGITLRKIHDYFILNNTYIYIILSTYLATYSVCPAYISYINVAIGLKFLNILMGVSMLLCYLKGKHIQLGVKIRNTPVYF